MWYSALYKDWDFNEGDSVVEVCASFSCLSIDFLAQGLQLTSALWLQSDILGYGGDGIAEERPQFIPKDKWNLLAEYSSTNTDELKDFVAVQLEIECADGSTTEKPERVTPAKASDGSNLNLLTDEEWERQYQRIYSKYQKKNEPKINTVSITHTIRLINLVVWCCLLLTWSLNCMSRSL